MPDSGIARVCFSTIYFAVELNVLVMCLGYESLTEYLIFKYFPFYGFHFLDVPFTLQTI